MACIRLHTLKTVFINYAIINIVQNILIRRVGRLMEEKPILTSCAFTGHRPTRFVFKYDELHPACAALKQAIEKQVRRLYRRGIRQFYTGCALGVDMWAGEIVLQLKEEYPDMELLCAVPFAGQEKAWRTEQQQRYLALLNKSSAVFILSDRYTEQCYFDRNRFLVDHADVLLAVYDTQTKKRSGTGYTVNYARQQKKPMLLIHPDTFQVLASKG